MCVGSGCFFTAHLHDRRPRSFHLSVFHPRCVPVRATDAHVATASWAACRSDSRIATLRRLAISVIIWVHRRLNIDRSKLDLPPPISWPECLSSRITSNSCDRRDLNLPTASFGCWEDCWLRL